MKINQITKNNILFPLAIAVVVCIYPLNMGFAGKQNQPYARGTATPEPGSSIFDSIQPEFSYQPPFLPIKLTIDGSGNIKLSGDISFVTPIGVFSIGASIPLVDKDDDDLVLVLRNSQEKTDSVYRISDGEKATIIVDGRTAIIVGRDQVIIDVTNSEIVEIIAPGYVNEYQEIDESVDARISENSTTVICKGAPPSDLYIGVKARVTWKMVNVRSYAEVSQDWDANIVTVVERDEVVEIVGGPDCAHEGYWWEVITDNGLRGWMREEDSTRVFLSRLSERESKQACSSTYPSRLQVGDDAYVAYDPPYSNNVRERPYVGAELVGQIDPGEKIVVLDGPSCSNNWVWWKIKSKETDLVGWTSEGNSDDYWLVPDN